MVHVARDTELHRGVEKIMSPGIIVLPRYKCIMDNIVIEQLNIDDIESVQEYSKLIIEVMEEFISNEITKFQNKGIGKKLLNYSIKYFMDEGIKLNHYRVFSSTYAREIYKSLGFIGEKNELYYYFGEKA